MDTDPTKLRSLAISAQDLVAATEARADGADAVLRVTPPFSGRMRARLHLVQSGETDDDTLHLEPSTLLAEDAPAYPTPDDTADELRADETETYSVERHRTYHEQRVETWRESLPSYAVDSVTPPAVGHEVTVSILGP
ncbi:hypothetical protein ACOZ4I_11050 [Haloarcula salina]|uniref:hypothetical protein n=1 Tax=Haloarcula salina TaxID=1429914 RepID=UPI003C701E07